MSILLTLLAKGWPYLLAAVAATYATHELDNMRYDRLLTTYASYQAQVAQENANAQQAAREALQRQIDERHAADLNNTQVMNDLKQRMAEADSHRSADAAFIRSLLEQSSQAGVPASHPVPAPGHQPGPPAARPPGGAEQVADLCADTKAEDEYNADRLDALLAQLKPQI